MSDNHNHLPPPRSFATIAIHEVQNSEQCSHNEVVTPITMTTTFKQTTQGVSGNYLYSRLGNPTRATLERVIAKLECAKHAACLASGMGSITTLLGLLDSGDHMICIDDVYGGTNNLFSKVATKFGIDVTFTENNLTTIENGIKSNTKLIFCETPTNPTIKICDIAAISKMAKEHKVLLAIDNTFLTPYFQRPILLGADIVIHSLSKYMNGHLDVCMGALVTNNDIIAEKIFFLQKTMGIVPSPFDCYLVLRSLKSLALRMKQHSRSSLVIAKYLQAHPKVQKVLHPGLPSHPQHDLAKKQSNGHSGIFSIYLDGDLEASKRFLDALKYFTIGVSLGGCESLIALPNITTHAVVPKEQREILGINDNLVRISVGLEDTDDLIEDLRQALEHI